jgi:hypothetical protein
MRELKMRSPRSAFRALGLAKTVEAVCEEIRELYLSDEIPWVVGYSGGKDSSAALQADDRNLLREVCNGDEVLFDLQVALLGVEQKFRGMTRRVGVIDALEKCLKAAIFEDEAEAFEVLSERDQRIKALKAREGENQMVLFREDR